MKENTIRQKRIILNLWKCVLFMSGNVIFILGIINNNLLAFIGGIFYMLVALVITN